MQPPAWTLLLSPEQWKAQFPRGAGILPPRGDSDHGFPQGCHKTEQSPQLFFILFDPHNLVTRFPKIWYLGTVNTLRIWKAALAGGTFRLSPEVGCKALVWQVPSLTWREASLFPKTTEHRGRHIGLANLHRPLDLPCALRPIAAVHSSPSLA